MDLQALPFALLNRQAGTQHPWWPLCLELDGLDAQLAARRLNQWLERGIPMDCVEAILDAHAATMQRRPAAAQPQRGSEHDAIRLDCFGTSLLDWQAHAWLQRCNLPRGFELTDAEDAHRVGLNLNSLDHWLSNPAGLLDLTRLNAVWDPDPTRVRVLQSFGIPARQLHADLASNGWLDRAGDPQDAMLALGLPHPASLAGSDSILVLGRAEAGSEPASFPGIYEWPDFDKVQLPDEDHARLLAHWLEHCSRHGIQIVRLSPSYSELHNQGFGSLSIGKPAQQLKPQFFKGALHLSVLREELSWRRQGRPAPAEPAPRRGQASAVWESGGADNIEVSVCISLYNYQHTIIKALESIKAQTQPGIELIVVDDSSSDESAKICLQWLKTNQLIFARTLLLQHAENAGLAAARNTGFATASAEWCFVLDADNELHPQALEQCLRMASHASEQIGVVHPLIQQINELVQNEGSRNLISGMSWQRQHFKEENYIDAMALIRRSAWQAVQGYTHIEHGWEDYDFWCKLIDHGYQGVLWPQVLAKYTIHQTSMINSRTNRNVRSISRLLQARHPWLDLPMARDDA